MTGRETGAADFFFTDEQQSGGAGCAELLQCGEGFERHDDAGFHVDDARAEELAAVFTIRHGGKRADRPDGVEVAEDEDAWAA